MPKLRVGAAKPAEVPQNGGGAPAPDLFSGETPSGDDLLGNLMGGMSFDLDGGAGKSLLDAIVPVSEKAIIAQIHKETGAGKGLPGIGADISALVAENVKTRTEVLGAVKALSECVEGLRKEWGALSKESGENHVRMRKSFEEVRVQVQRVEDKIDDLTVSAAPEPAPAPVVAAVAASAQKAAAKPTTDPQLEAILKQAWSQIQARAPQGGNVVLIPLVHTLRRHVPHLTAEQVIQGMTDAGWPISGEKVNIPPQK